MQDLFFSVLLFYVLYYDSSCLNDLYNVFIFFYLLYFVKQGSHNCLKVKERN